MEKDFENIEEIADVDPKSNDLESKPLNHAEEDSKIVADDENDAKAPSEEYVDVLGPWKLFIIYSSSFFFCVLIIIINTPLFWF